MFIRKLLIHLLGFERYLRLLSFVFLKTYRSGIFLKAHEQVRFLAHLVRQDDVCLDIGANLGYFSIPLSRLVGAEGKVLAVEPVLTFREVLLQNIARFALDNVEVLPFALGEKDGEAVQMGTPRVEVVIRHGRTQIIEDQNELETQLETPFTHEVEMRTPDSLFQNLEGLDFVKCDVEGYELHILPLLLSILECHLPILEIEIGPEENKKAVLEMLSFGGYQPYFLEMRKLKPFILGMKGVEELYFVPDRHQSRLSAIWA